MRDAALIAALSQLVDAHPGWGFWTCCTWLRKRHTHWNHKRLYRVYKAMKLHARKRLPKRDRIALSVPVRLNHVWSVDFISDALACGRRFRTVNVIDDFNRQSVHIEIDTSINSARLVRIFEQIKRDQGLAKIIRTDNGPEFLGEAFKQWSTDNDVVLQHIQPSKPNQNAFIERFNRTFREDVLD